MDKNEDPVMTGDTNSDTQTVDQNAATKSLIDESEGIIGTKFDTDERTADQSTANESFINKQPGHPTKFYSHQHTKESIGHITQSSQMQRQETVSYILFLVAMVTMCQGLGFFAASILGGSVPFLPRDPITLIGMMHTLMGFGFLAISLFCRYSKTRNRKGHCIVRDVLKAHVPQFQDEKAKKAD